MTREERKGAHSRQRDVFLEGEGDAYEDRNARADANPEVLRPLVPYLRPGESVLEIGCGSGHNLVALQRLAPGISCFGIDPSKKAIERGRICSPHHRLEVGTADSIPFEGEFSLVIFGFCLYLCDRSLLHASVAEADRVLQGGDSGEKGILAILDFDPSHPHRRTYRHDPRLSSFKMDYSALFLANPAYQLATKLSFSHSRGTQGRPSDPNDQVALWILEKDMSVAFPSLD